MKRFLGFALLLINTCLHAQIAWHDPMQAGFLVIQNSGWPEETGKSYTRLPMRMKETLRVPVWNLSQNAAGLSLRFYTSAKTVFVRYKVVGAKAMNHMPATGVSGIDLYAKATKNWDVASASFSFGDTVQYTFNNLISNNKAEYQLFLPLYNTIKWMEIGVQDSSTFKFLPIISEKPIVVYGTSIAQGACASRPAMAWTNILARQLNVPVINLGFSGNGPLENEMIDYINELDAKAYILDGLPNMGSLTENEIYKRVIYSVTTLRRNHAAPIILAEHIGYANANTNSENAIISAKCNNALLKAFYDLKRKDVSNIWYLSKNEINLEADAYVDYIHPNDWGMRLYAAAYEKLLRKVLSIK